jgi:hypothetical protein
MLKYERAQRASSPQALSCLKHRTSDELAGDWVAFAPMRSEAGALDLMSGRGLY